MKLVEDEMENPMIKFDSALIPAFTRSRPKLCVMSRFVLELL